MADEHLALGVDRQRLALFGAVVDSIDQVDCLDGKVVAGFGFEQHLERLGQVAVAAGRDESDFRLLVGAHLDGVADGVAVGRPLAVGEGNVVRTRPLDLEGDSGGRAVELGG